MGIFPHLVEATARDINQLLKLQKVHPQVRSDVKRHLDALIQKSYQEVFDLPEHQKESTFQVCNSLVNEIVNTCLTIDIPRADLAATEQNCIILEERVQNMEEHIKYYESYRDDLKMLLNDIKASHYYMLHSYFREVLILRRRIDHLKKRMQKENADRLSIALLKPSSASSGDLKNNSRKNLGFAIKKYKSAPNLTSEGGKIDQQLKSQFSTLAVISNPTAVDNDPNSPTVGQTISNSESFCRPYRVVVQEHPMVVDECSQPEHNISRCTPESDASCSLSKKSNMESFESGGAGGVSYGLSDYFASGKLKISDLEQMLQRISRSEETVDAIFDYEEYIRLLNRSHNDFEERIEKVLHEREKVQGYLSKHHRSNIADNSLTFCSETMKLFQNRLEHQHNLGISYQWNLHFAIDLVKENFYEIIDQLRKDMNYLKQKYEDDMSLMSQMFLLQESRSNALADCFISFMHDISIYLENINKSLECKHCCDLFRVPPSKVHHFEEIFKQCSEAKYSGKLRRLLDKVKELPDLDCSFLWGIHFYVNSPIVKDAEYLLKAFSKGYRKLQRRLKNLLLQNELLFTERVNGVARCSRPTSRPQVETEATGKEKFELWRKSNIEGAGGMTGEDLLKELVSLRFRRAANRVRLARFEKMLNAEEDENKIKQYTAICSAIKRQIAKDTARITELLRLLYFSLREFGIKPSFTIISSSDLEDDLRSFVGRTGSKGTLYSIVGGLSHLDTDGNCIYFNDERIPISFFSNNNSPCNTYTRAEVGAAYTGEYEYYTGVQLGRPANEGMRPSYHYHNDEVFSCFEPLAREATAAVDDKIMRDPSIGGRTGSDQETMPMTRILYPGYLPTEIALTTFRTDDYGPSSTMNPNNVSPFRSNSQDKSAPSNLSLKHESFQPAEFTASLEAPELGNQKQPCILGKTEKGNEEENDNQFSSIASPAPLLTSYQNFIANDGSKGDINGTNMAQIYRNPYLYSLPPRVYSPSAEDQSLLSVRPIQGPSVEISGSKFNRPFNLKDNRMTAAMHVLKAYSPPLSTDACVTEVNASPSNPLKEGLELPNSTQTTEFPISSVFRKAKQMRAERVKREVALKQELQRQRETERSLKEAGSKTTGNEEYHRLEIPKLPTLFPKPQQTAQLQRDQFLAIYHARK